MNHKSDHHLTLFGRSIRLPKRRFMRVILGSVLILAGLLGFLPVLGFWMLPLGILVLSHDSKSVRRFKRKMMVKYGRLKAHYREKGRTKQK